MLTANHFSTRQAFSALAQPAGQEAHGHSLSVLVCARERGWARAHMNRLVSESVKPRNLGILGP
jgi:hypothetical protein